ncbi:MAG: hypothetical protein U0N43_11535 [Mediterraneibacter sp.]
MKRKSIMVIVAAVMMISITACGKTNGNTANGQSSNGQVEQEQGNTDVEVPINKESSGGETTKAESLDELNELVIQNLENRVAALNSQYEELKNEIDTYEKFSANIQDIENFYSDIYEKTRDICIEMREYSLDYARFILDSDGDKNDKYDDLEELYDTVYDDGGELIYDEIYDGILDEVYDVFYDGILDEAYDTVGYEEWYDTCSDEFERWYDTRSDVYEEWYDTRSDIYEFYYDLRSELWDADFEKAEEIIQEFREDTSNLKES